MTLELIKRLKEKGYPFELIQMSHRITAYKEEKTGTVFAMPTLSELIEACGDDLQILYQTTDTDDATIEWRCGNAINANISRGSTPEIAVANLWLEINK